MQREKERKGEKEKDEAARKGCKCLSPAYSVSGKQVSQVEM